MDVRCERCKTDYEFDDARITEAGVTVKCTTCGHVFKVKKKALVVTVPVNPEDGQMGLSPASSVAAPPAGAGTFIPGEKPLPKDKEWKVRQANGNVFSFKELTTLQKWIVERKVNREDEISLNGETWKRLGNIAELASFFQVVEEAQKGQQLAALQSAGALAYLPPGAAPAGGYAIPSGDTMGAQTGYPGPAMLRPSNPSLPAMIQPGMQSAALSASGGPIPPQGSPQVNITVHSPFSPQAAAPAPVLPAAGLAPAAASVVTAAQEDLAAAQINRSGAGRALLIGLAVAVLAGGGYYGYFGHWLPQQEAKKREAQERVQAEVERKAAQARAAAEEKAKKEAEALVAAEAAKAEEAARVAAADAGTVSPGGEAALAAAKKPRDFDGWMALGDKLRDREKAEQALDAYGRASDLNPDRAEPHAGRGLALLDMGSKLQAESAFTQALKLNPRYGVALMGLAETYRLLGNNEQAKQYYERYLDVLPSGPEAEVARQALKRLQE